MVPWVLIGVPVLVALTAMGGYNNLRARRHRVRDAWSEVEVQLRRRCDLIQRLAEAAKRSGQREREALVSVMNACRQTIEAHDIPARAEAENQLTEALRCFFARAAACPELKALPNTLVLLEELTVAEERIASARRFYNDQVMAWNVRIARFPGRLVSRAAGLRPAEYFVLDEPARGEALPGPFRSCH